MSATYDAIVIGGGPNGLVAGAYLARAGRRVAVLEAAGGNAPGEAVGEASREAFGAEGSVRDVVGPAPMLQLVVRELGLTAHGCGIEPIDPCRMAPSAAGPLFFWQDVAKTSESIARHSTEDAKAWPAFVEMIHATAGFLRGMWEGPPLDPLTREPRELVNAMKLGLGLRRLGPARMKDVMRVAPMSVAELLDDWFESDVLKGALAAIAVEGLRQGPMAVGTAFSFLHHHVGAQLGVVGPMYRLKAGTAGLVQALTDQIQGSGGVVERGSRVARVDVEAGRAIGVTTERGDPWRAGVVLSSVDPQSTFLKLVDPMLLETEFVRAVRNIRIDGVVSVVTMTLSDSPRLSGVDPVPWDGLITVAPSIDFVERAFDSTKYGEMSDRPVLQLRLHRAPAGGQASATALAQYTPYQLSGGEWDEAAKEQVSLGVRTVLKEWLPEVGAVVQDVTVLSPADLERSLGVTGGHVHHGDLALDQALFMRPVPQAAQYRSPIQGLYLCGAGSHPGGGLHGIPGRNAAAEVLLDQKRGTFGAKNQL